jgi:hypothetical protein
MKANLNCCGQPLDHLRHAAAFLAQHLRAAIFITLEPPTGPTKKEAVKAGFYEPPHHKKVPKIQILTIAELFEGKKPALVDVTAFKKAAKEETQQGKFALTVAAFRCD